MVVKRANLFRLPSEMPIDDGAFIEPITVGLHAFHLAQGCEGKNVIIVGAGTIGLLAMQCARELGAKSITAIDINPQKLALAKELGATYVFNSREMSATEIHSGLENIQFDQLIHGDCGNPTNCYSVDRNCRTSRSTGISRYAASRSGASFRCFWANIA